VFVNVLWCYNKVKAKLKYRDLGFGKLDTGEQEIKAGKSYRKANSLNLKSTTC